MRSLKDIKAGKENKVTEEKIEQMMREIEDTCEREKVQREIADKDIVEVLNDVCYRMYQPTSKDDQ